MTCSRIRRLNGRRLYQKRYNRYLALAFLSDLSLFVYKEIVTSQLPLSNLTLQLILEHTQINTNEALRTAVERSNVATVSLLIQYPPIDVNHRGGYCIRTATWNKSSVIVGILIAAGADVNLNIVGCASALRIALLNCPVSIVIQLLSAGATLPDDFLRCIHAMHVPDRDKKFKEIQKYIKYIK